MIANDLTNDLNDCFCVNIKIWTKSIYFIADSEPVDCDIDLTIDLLSGTKERYLIAVS